MVPEVGGQGLADVGGQRKAGVLASLAPHLQLAGPPIDVIEFQGENLARPQPQAGQKEEDGAITAGGAVVPLASTDDPFDLFGVRYFGSSADRHCGTVGTAPARSLSVCPLRKRNRKKERRAVTIILAMSGLPARACRKRKREMSPAARSRTRIGPSPKRSTRRRRANCQ